MVKVSEQGSPLREGRIEEIERKIGARLPESYRRFLRQFNGGVPSPDVIEVDGLPGNPTDVQVLFGIDGAIESNNLLWHKDAFSNRLPARLLPIACDSGGNLFCLSLADKNFGAVVYVDFEPTDPAQYAVASNFDLFLSRIREH